jgi:hypothetical protein
LPGWPNVAAAVKRAAGVKGDLDAFGAMHFLAGLLVILRDSGRAGLVLVLDEVETLQRMRADTREKGLNALRQLVDEIDAGRYPGLYLVVTGTSAFFDGPQGVQRLAPLAQRLHTDFATDARYDNPRAVQVRLPSFDLGMLARVGVRVRDLFAEEADAVGRSRWLGSARPLSRSLGRAIERIAAGDEPGCTLSRRASARLAEIRERLDFVDGSSMPVVRDAAGRTTVWTFAGDRANAMLAGSLRLGGMSVASADGLALVVRDADATAVAAAITRVDPARARPEAPLELASELKFSECLPPKIAAAVVEGRLSDRAALDEALRRPRRVITVAG